MNAKLLLLAAFLTIASTTSPAVIATPFNSVRTEQAIQQQNTKPGEEFKNTSASVFQTIDLPIVKKSKPIGFGEEDDGKTHRIHYHRILRRRRNCRLRIVISIITVVFIHLCVLLLGFMHLIH